ncbi:unnamed protein product [Hymenolepis diminuta]|uniref:WD_REPEATS_REGION domain-containing protein n=1 Tax=Hymenolepis diminuta TaxID=6216 RepID=A0A0R3SPH3_HYMDI|nr:unnamed protein product [Hymenolepis diminuta]
MNTDQLSIFDNQPKVLGPDARRVRKAVFRRTIDYNASIMNYLRNRIWQSSPRHQIAIQPDYLYSHLLSAPIDYLDNPVNSVTGKLVRTSTNKNKCPIYCVCWTPEGRRLITGAFTGEFTLWNGLTFNFETILQAHESQIRCMKWSHNDEWLLTADHAGYVKYWQENMNNVQAYQAHKMPIRGVSFSPFDDKFVTCSDDATVRVWDFLQCIEERALRGHGSDVRSIAWHPYKSLVISGSKDAQQPIKLWDPKTGEAITTLYAHKNTCTDVAWNMNGNWFLTASRDHLIKLFDLRFMKEELQTFRGHKKEVTRIVWHPVHENLFASGSGDGAIHFWCAGNETELGVIDGAHDNMIWSLAWHPLGHILVSGGNDFSTKFWTRDRPGDGIKDFSSPDIIETFSNQATEKEKHEVKERLAFECPIDPIVEIPGLEDDLAGISYPRDEDSNEEEASKNRTVPTKPVGSISKEFVANWSSSRNLGKPGVVLTAIAAAKGRTTESGLEEKATVQGGKEGGDNGGMMDTSKIVATPLVTSDMCMNPKAKASANEIEEYEATPGRFKSRTFDSAVREEEMLAFANSLMPPSPPNSAQQPIPTDPSVASIPQAGPGVETMLSPLVQQPPPPIPPNQPPPPQMNARFGPLPPPSQRFMGGLPPGMGYRSGPPMGFRRPPLPPMQQFGGGRPPPFNDQQWGGPPPPGGYNGPPPGYGAPSAPQMPPNKRSRRW